MIARSTCSDDFIKEMAEKGLDGTGALQLVKELADKYNEIYHQTLRFL